MREKDYGDSRPYRAVLVRIGDNEHDFGVVVDRLKGIMGLGFAALIVISGSVAGTVFLTELFRHITKP